MLDLKRTLADLDRVKEKMEQRGEAVDFDRLEGLATRRRELITAYNELRHEQRNAGASMRGLDPKGEEALQLRARLKEVSTRLRSLDTERTETEASLRELLLYVPNLPDDSVPIGASEADNPVRSVHGEARNFDFEPKPHWELGEQLGILDLERSGKVSGARFAFLLGAGARLERALVSFMLDLHTREHGYREILPPFLVNRDSMTGTGQLPKFEEDAFKTDNDLFLIPTAEVPVTNYHRDEILDGDVLPIRYAAYTPCFRLEAGSYGKDTRGLIRQHQFDKVELVRFERPEDSRAAHDELVEHAATVLRRLDLPYRIVELCTGDLGFSAARCFDIEVWVPSQRCYREISSCSCFDDFQARRASIRFRREKKGKPDFVHTLNGSGLAVGRTVVALLENHQREDGSIHVPEPLRPWLGCDLIEAET